jgi:hypothetical protein
VAGSYELCLLELDENILRHVNNRVTPWSRVLLEKLIVTQLFKFPSF